jgi:hypothetical protein
MHRKQVSRPLWRQVCESEPRLWLWLGLKPFSSKRGGSDCLLQPSSLHRSTHDGARAIPLARVGERSPSLKGHLIHQDLAGRSMIVPHRVTLVAPRRSEMFEHFHQACVRPLVWRARGPTKQVSDRPTKDTHFPGLETAWVLFKRLSLVLLVVYLPSPQPLSVARSLPPLSLLPWSRSSHPGRLSRYRILNN